MTTIQAIILGIIEGITEFLPISSTAHLVIASNLLGLEQSAFLKSFEIIIQLGAVAAVIFLYTKTILKRPALIGKIIAGFIPTAIIGFALYSFVKTFLLGNLVPVVWSLLIGGIILISYEWYEKKREFTHPSISPIHDTALTHMPYRSAVVIGVAQALAIIPGVSRSAATITAGRMLGLDKRAATEFSFLLALPTIAAAAGYDILKNPHIFETQHLALIVVGFAVSFITAVIAIKSLLAFIQRFSFAWFGVYRIVLALLLVAFLMH